MRNTQNQYTQALADTLLKVDYKPRPPRRRALSRHVYKFFAAFIALTGLFVYWGSQVRDSAKSQVPQQKDPAYTATVTLPPRKTATQAVTQKRLPLASTNTTVHGKPHHKPLAGTKKVSSKPTNISVQSLELDSTVYPDANVFSIDNLLDDNQQDLYRLTLPPLFNEPLLNKTRVNELGRPTLEKEVSKQDRHTHTEDQTNILANTLTKTLTEPVTPVPQTKKALSTENVAATKKAAIKSTETQHSAKLASSTRAKVTKPPPLFAKKPDQQSILTLPHPPRRFPRLRSRYDSRLQKKLEQTLSDLGLGTAIAKKQLSVALVDITSLKWPYLALVNGDTMMYAASLPKIAILLGAFVEIEQGKMHLDDRTYNSLSQMIRVSSNWDATLMLNKVGKHRLIEILQSPRFRLYDPKYNGGLWVGKEYARGTAYHRDPLHNLSHGATAFQIARFYYLLETEQLVSPSLSRQMKKILAKPGIKHKFVKGLENKADVRLYRKSGSWGHWHCDSAIVEAGNHRYIIAALTEHSQGSHWLTKMAGPLHELVAPTQVAQAADKKD